MCIGAGLIRSGSVQFAYIGFQFFFGYSSLFQFVNDGFCQIFYIFIYFFSHLTRWGMVFGSMPYTTSAFFSKSLQTVSVTATLLSKNFICSSSVLTFFIHFSIISFCCFTCSSKYVWRSSSDIAGSVIFRFSSLGRDSRRAVFWPVVFVGVAVGLDLLSLLPETKVFVVFDHFVRRQLVVLLLITLHVRHLTSAITRSFFHFIAKICVSLCSPIDLWPRDTKMFLTSLTRGMWLEKIAQEEFLRNHRSVEQD